MRYFVAEPVGVSAPVLARVALSNSGKHAYHFPEVWHTDTLKVGSVLFGLSFVTHFSLCRGLTVDPFGMTPEVHIFPVRTTVPEWDFVCTAPIASPSARTEDVDIPANRTLRIPRSLGSTKSAARSKSPEKRAVEYAWATGPGAVAGASVAGPEGTGVADVPGALHPVP
ncbi:hypothetical protein ACWD25_50015, partial [Streptomyces sp. NPDC002920]